MITGPRETVKRARKLRSEMSLPETALWRELRKRPGGFKLRRQHSAGNYILDFYCAKAKLAIEVDGSVHDNPDAIGRDAARSHFLRAQGIATTRIPARMILSDMEACVKRIVEICEQRVLASQAKNNVPLHHPSDGPPPRSEEE